MTDTDILFRAWISDLANPDSQWEYGNGIPIAPDAKSFLAEFDRLRAEIERLQEAEYLLLRLYFSSRRDGWEDTEKEEHVVDRVVDHFSNTISGEWPSGWDLERSCRALMEDKDG